MNKYDKCIELWDDIFSKQESVLPKKKESGNVEFDKGLAWLTDNLYPDDAISVLEEIKRILKKNGKLLVKLNPFISDEQIEEYGIKKISGNLLDDGMILWNNTNEEWEDILGARYSISDYVEIYYEEYGQINRMYLLTK